MGDIKKVILIGASGVLGKAVLKALQRDGSFDVTVLSRPESQATWPDDVTVVRAEYHPDTLRPIFQGHDAVICTTGLAGIAQQKIFIDLCITTGVRRYITNDFGNAIEYRGLPELEFARRPRLEILEYVKSRQTETLSQGDASVFTWTSLATGHFLDYALIKFPAFGFDLAKRSARLVDGGDEPFCATTVGDIGIAVVGILRRERETANRCLLVRSLMTTQRDLLAAFERETGSSTGNDGWEVEHVSARVLRDRGVQRLEAGDRGAMLDLVPAQLYERGAGRAIVEGDRYDNALVGVEEKSVDVVVRQVLDEWSRR